MTNMQTNGYQRALVVGGTSGIGKGIALALAKRGGIEVTVAGRSAARGEEVVQLLQSLPKQQDDIRHKFLPIDAFDLKSVKKFGENHVKENNGVGPDLLVLTQGMATIQGYTPTVDKIDQKLQLHYFSRFFLTRQLLPHMKPESRVLSVLSGGVHGKYKDFEQDFELKQNYSIKNAADAAGFYHDAGFETLAMQNTDKILAHAAPGFVNTSWGTEMPWLLREVFIRPLQKLFGKSLEDVGENMVKGLFSDELKGPSPTSASGRYFLINERGEVIKDPKAIKHTPAEREIIFEKTLKLLPDILS